MRTSAMATALACLSAVALADERRYKNLLGNDISQSFHTKTPWKFEVGADSDDDVIYRDDASLRGFGNKKHP